MGNAVMDDVGIEPWPGCVDTILLSIPTTRPIHPVELAYLFGRVNMHSLGDYEAGTLLCEDSIAHAQRNGRGDGTPVTDTLVFRHRPMPWNCFTRPSDGRYYEMRSLTGELPYREYDFRGIINRDA